MTDSSEQFWGVLQEVNVLTGRPVHVLDNQSFDSYSPTPSSSPAPNHQLLD